MRRIASLQLTRKLKEKAKAKERELEKAMAREMDKVARPVKSIFRRRTRCARGSRKACAIGATGVTSFTRKVTAW